MLLSCTTHIIIPPLGAGGNGSAARRGHDRQRSVSLVGSHESRMTSLGSSSLGPSTRSRRARAPQSWLARTVAPRRYHVLLSCCAGTPEPPSTCTCPQSPCSETPHQHICRWQPRGGHSPPSTHTARTRATRHANVAACQSPNSTKPKAGNTYPTMPPSASAKEISISRREGLEVAPKQIGRLPQP